MPRGPVVRYRLKKKLGVELALIISKRIAHENRAAAFVIANHRLQMRCRHFRRREREWYAPVDQPRLV